MENNKNESKVASTTDTPITSNIPETTTANNKPAETKPNKPEVNMSKFEKIVSNLIQENELLRKNQEELLQKIEGINSSLSKPNIAKKIKEHFVRLSIYDGQIIVGFDGDFYNVWDEKRRTDVLMVDLILQDGKKIKEVDVMKMLNNGKFIEAKILERKKNEVSKSDGVVNKVEFDGDYSMVAKDTLVELESIKINTIFVVELPNGEKLEIDERYVNIQ